MRYSSAAEFEKKFDEIFADVVAGETIIITDNKTGEPIAEFVPSGMLGKSQRVKIAREIRKSSNVR